MVRDRWLQAHPYLEPVARFQGAVDDALARLSAGVAPAAEPSFEAHAADYRAGIPLLAGGAWAPDAAPAGALLARLVGELASAPLPGNVQDQCQALSDGLGADPARPAAAMGWVLGAEGEFVTPNPGLLRFLGWEVARALHRPVFDRFRAWRDAQTDAAWRLDYCPTCGAHPVLALLTGREAGRQRLLSCSLCGTRWEFKRIGCPYCGNDDQAGLDLVEIEGEEGLRLDLCRGCKGYVKTVTTDQNPAFLLADWTTLHVDVLAREQGFLRKGDSLYEV
jgi:FdhE protein